MQAPLVSLIIPTQRRRDGLITAALSTFRQVGVDLGELELVIVDNDEVDSARSTARALADEAPFPVIYVHEPEPGVANARNAAMAQAKGELIAFLDDDEEAPEGWLAALLGAMASHEADVVFGPVRGRAPESVVAHRAYLERFFSREGPAQAGLLDYYYGCGCSLLRRASLPDRNHPFSAIRNHIGGEDDLLFGQMKRGGARFAWEPAAWVWEDPVPARLSLAYTIPRAFAYGQGPSSACAAASPPDRLGVARWMTQGLVQAAVFGALAGVKCLVRAPDFAPTLDRAARGLGKTLWWGPFKIHFYGLRAGA
ncbi:glycosyltransferase family 2 protein [Phenylobacterium sp.]|uniref:glycosyltransferase family 2 protein n=1 Tax=Phenylobacterium sp. TaxID=1871053 RepID=UPI0027331A50|nr:glycosyltransferase family 2 protein [Phenylobacterium sp.]MDP3854920.1 glycosyltransferase family 2 protein [Phenylobacterium sp.]